MARSNGAKTKSVPTTPVVEAAPIDETEMAEAEQAEPETEPETESAIEPETTSEAEALDIEDCLNALKVLLSTVEKLQKVRQEVGDIKPLLVRMLDGEVVTGAELEQLKTGVNGLFRLVRAYSDHQAALTKAQPARQLLDDVLKVKAYSGS